MSQDALKIQKQLESGYLAEIATVDNTALKMFPDDETAAREYLYRLFCKISPKYF